MARRDAIGFDADGTPRQNGAGFQPTEERSAALPADHADPATLVARLDAAERRTLGAYGLGIRGLELSMIESAIEVTGGRVPGAVIGPLLAAGREMLAHAIALVPHARDAVLRAATHWVLLVTKGGPLDHERTLAQSGPDAPFHDVELVSDTTPAGYARAFSRRGGGPGRAITVGNPPKSDGLAAIEAGGFGTSVPHRLTSAHKNADPPPDRARSFEVPDLPHLQVVIAAIEAR